MTHALALAEHRNFARAAEALHLSQPALTRSIQTFEEQMGTPLFIRARKGVELTDAGQLMLKRARAIVSQSQDLMREGMILRKTKGTEIRVAAGPYAGHLILAPTVARQLAAEPGLRFDLRIDHWVKVTQMLKERRMDLAICESSELDDRELEILPLRAHRAAIAVRPGHPLLSGGGPVDFKRIVKWQIAITARLPPRILRPMFTYFTGSSFAPTVHCEDVGVIKTIVMDSDAVGFFPLAMIRHELEQGLLQVVNVEAPWLETCFAVIWLKDRLLSESVRSFIREVQATDEELAQAEEELSVRFSPRRRPARNRASAHINGTSITK